MLESDDPAMDLRLRNLQMLTELSITMNEITEENVRQLEETVRQLEEHQRRMLENQRRMLENRIRRDAAMQQIIQLVTTLQAEIVRIDATHS